ncbi:TPA: hypothetical protein ACIWSA_004990 [Escherichia coli]
MNQLEEKLQRMISLYKEDNCQKVPENIAELMELASEFSGMLKSSGVRSAFFVEMLMHGGLMATMRRVMEDQKKEPPQVYVLSAYFHERRSLNNFHRDRVITFEQIAE